MFTIRERIYTEVRVDTEDDRLTILALDCYTTPSQDRNSQPRYDVIIDGYDFNQMFFFATEIEFHHKSVQLIHKQLGIVTETKNSFVDFFNFALVCRCAVDDTLKFHPRPDPQSQRFSLEAFQYVSKHPYVFLHCKVQICNATDQNSRCAQGCVKRGRRSVRTLP